MYLPGRIIICKLIHMYLDGTTTDRLLFRKLTISDVNLWEKFLESKEILPYLGFDQDANPHELAVKWINKQLWRYDHNQFGHHALIHRKTNELIGQAGLLTQEANGQKEIEIGYHILPHFRNLHYATEAAGKVRDYAFENNITSSLISIIHQDNIPSQKVAKNIGMEKDRKLEKFNRDIKKFGIFFIFRINKNNWKKKL